MFVFFGMKRGRNSTQFPLSDNCIIVIAEKIDCAWRVYFTQEIVTLIPISINVKKIEEWAKAERDENWGCPADDP